MIAARRWILLVLMLVLPVLGLADTLPRACPMQAVAQGAHGCCDATHAGGDHKGSPCKPGVVCSSLQAFHADTGAPIALPLPDAPVVALADAPPRSFDPDGLWRPPRSR